MITAGFGRSGATREDSMAPLVTAPIGEQLPPVTHYCWPLGSDGCSVQQGGEVCRFQPSGAHPWRESYRQRGDGHADSLGSPRERGLFVKVSYPSIPGALLESEFVGTRLMDREGAALEQSG